MSSKKKLLEKPIHVALLKPSYIQKLEEEGKLPPRRLSLSTPPQQKLPDGKVPPPPKPVPAYQAVAERGATLRRQTMMKTHLKVLHESVKPIPKDLKPPCTTCKTAPCCYVFMVNLTPEEYESGLYGEYAVKLTHHDAENLGMNRFTRLATMNMPSVHAVTEGNPQYFLEGPVGQPCPMLQEDNSCGIYEKRPLTCRTYTCVGDTRIDDDMRAGKTDIENIQFSRLMADVIK